MMNRIEKTLKRMQEEDKKMLSPYLTAGDPTRRDTVQLMHTLVAAGANILEIGIPFSDPMAEGPVIQAAMERALSHHVTCDDVLAMVEEFRTTDKDTPVVLMGYLNPIEQYGYKAFAKNAADVGVDGTIIVDLPPEESKELISLWDKFGLYSIYLCSPTTTSERMQLINTFGRGYIYYVSLKGVTGAATIDLEQVKLQYRLRKSQSKLPIIVGFGIKSPEMAALVADFADGVVVGAELITRINAAYNAKEDLHEQARELISGMRAAMDSLAG